jgi:hypothetical protein
MKFISGITRVVKANLKIENYKRAITLTKSLNREMPTICTTALGTW